jgi:hypothetical protein
MTQGARGMAMILISNTFYTRVTHEKYLSGAPTGL